MRMKSKHKILFFCLFASIVFLNLGIWQINRHNEKQELTKFIDSQMSSPLVSLKETKEDLSFRKASAKGDFLTYVLISGRYFYSEEGYGLIALFKPKNSDTHYIVDRGWISKKSSFLNSMSEKGSVEGLVVPFAQFTKEESKPVKEEKGIAVFSYMDPLSIRSHFKAEIPDLEIAGFVVLHGSENKKGELIEKADGELVSWWVLPQQNLPHLGYAITWFGLFVVSCLFGIQIKKRN